VNTITISKFLQIATDQESPAAKMATEAVPTRTLNVEVISASGLKNTELFGKSDPYVVLSVGKTQKKSTVAKDQPTTPAWNETFTLPVLEADTDLSVTIKNDVTLGRDEDMGHILIPLSLIQGGSYSASVFPLELKGKTHGEIILSLSFEGEGHQAHHEAHGLAEQVEGLSVVDTPEHHEGESVSEGHPEEGHHGGLKKKTAGLKERKHRKKEKKHRGSGDEGGSSSSSSESDKE
jgi:Ca2+-dependent lipid-binding protein